jgi:hypothetical protein
MNYYFPLAFAINFFAMTGFMVILGLIGKSNLAADVGIVQGATLALFYAFSANARNLILNASSNVSISPLLLSRITLLVPLGSISFLLSTSLPEVSWALALILIIRRCTEWISELHLSLVEVNRDRFFARNFFFLQVFLLFVALLGAVISSIFFWIGTLVWAISPLALHIQFIRENFSLQNASGKFYEHLFPHFGSTAITGATVYIFRLIILILAGKVLAGDLYTAYAIGGFLSSLFVYALGPSLALQNNQKNEVVLPGWLKFLLGLLIAAGFFLFIISETELGELNIFGKSNLFWSATGLSMIGGSMMLLAQRIRISLLQLFGDQDVLGPDLIINILMLSFVTFSFYIIGPGVLKFLFLANSVIAFLFYYSAKQGITFKRLPLLKIISENNIRFMVALILVFPLFFQLSGKIFNDPIILFDSQANLARLPIPISVIACFGGLFLIGNYQRSKIALYMLFLTFMGLLGTTLVSTKDSMNFQSDKLILMMQFILPMFALILGQIYETKGRDLKLFEKAILWVILIIVPSQLIASWISGLFILSPYLYLFSIYQQLQYVPTIFIGLYLIAMFSLWDISIYKIILILLAPLMSLYAVLSQSVLTNIALYTGLIFFVTLRYVKLKDKLPAVLFIIMICLSSSVVFALRNDEVFYEHFLKKLNIRPQATAQNQSNYGSHISHRATIWEYHLNGILSDAKNLFLGNTTRPDRAEYPSAHNYYLDMVYNFGIIPLLPVCALLLLTVKKILNYRKKIGYDFNILGLVLVTFFFLLIDNFFKVGLRQPYPGIITFFLWGLLLSRLSIFHESHVNVTNAS